MAISPTFCLWFHLATEVSMTKPYWSGSHLPIWLCQSTGIQSLQLRPCPSLTCPVKPFMPVAASVHPVPIYFVALHPDAAHPTCCSRLHTCCQPKKIWLVAIPCTEGGRRWVRMQVWIWSVSTRTSGLRDFAICDVLEDNKSSMLACAQNVVCDGWARSLHCYQNMEVHSCTTAVVVTPCFHLTDLPVTFNLPLPSTPPNKTDGVNGCMPNLILGVEQLYYLVWAFRRWRLVYAIVMETVRVKRGFFMLFLHVTWRLSSMQRYTATRSRRGWVGC